MPTAATTAAAPPQGGSRGRGDARTVVPTVPFIRASAKHREPTGIDVSRVLTAASQDLGVFDIPAYGYIRSILILVTATGGVGGGAVVAAHEDAPFSSLTNIALTEPNGAQISAFNSGHDLYLAQKWGGYAPVIGGDPKGSPAFSAPAAGAGASGNFSYLLRIPVELNTRDGLGSLPNQNAAATFKLRLGLAAAGAIYTVVPATTLPTVRVRVFLEAWEQPVASEGGMNNSISPPAVNTTQFWSTQVHNVNAGQQTIRLTRTGNYVRNLIAVYRRGGTSRANGHADFADPITLMKDARAVDIIERNNWLNQMYERSGYGRAGVALDAAFGLDAGVFVYDYTHEFDGTYGMENRDLWEPTLGSSRIEFTGSFGQAGTLTVLTNDVAVAGSVFI